MSENPPAGGSDTPEDQAPSPPYGQQPPPPPYGQQPSYGSPSPYPYGQQQPPYGQPGQGQPAYGGYGQYGHGAPGGPPPDNYLVWAILTTLFCCLPLGIVSIVFSAQVNSKWQAGDVAGAQDSARKAKQFALWSALSVLVIGVIGILFAVIGSIASVNTSP